MDHACCLVLDCRYVSSRLCMSLVHIKNVTVSGFNRVRDRSIIADKPDYRKSFSFIETHCCNIPKISLPWRDSYTDGTPVALPLANDKTIIGPSLNGGQPSFGRHGCLAIPLQK